jgi:predicted acyltransferase
MRAARIVLLGLALQAFNYVLHDMPYFRPFGVLQRIGICFAAVGLFAIYTRPRTQWIALSSLLLGYWAMMAWGGDMTREGNLAARIDTWLLGPLCYQYDPATGMGFEPEGVLSTLPAIGTALLGLRAGDWLRRGDVQRLWSMGTYGVLFGFVWSLAFPINKQLWTSSYVLWTGGLAMIALGTFHALMDKKRMPPIGKSFGMNAIFAYAGAWLLASVLGATGAHQALYATGFGWMIPRFGAEAASLAYASVFVAFWWLVVKGMDRRKIHLKI